MKRIRKTTLSAALTGIMLATAACGPAYEGTVTVVEKDKDSRYVKMGNTRYLRDDYEVKLCPKKAESSSEYESMECFWTGVTRNEYVSINVNDVFTYSDYNIQR